MIGYSATLAFTEVVEVDLDTEPVAFRAGTDQTTHLGGLGLR